MKSILFACIFSATLLLGCGGGGGNPGTCSGSAVYCADAAVMPSTGSGFAAGTNPVSGTLFANSGTGDAVFNLPTGVTRIRIKGSFVGVNSNFIVRISGQLVVNQILDASKGTSDFEGTYLIDGGGVVEITNSNGVAWNFAAVPPESNAATTGGTFAKTGAGDSVFDLPVTVSRVRIQGSLSGISTNSNFIVKIGGELKINEILNRSRNTTTFEGTYLLTGNKTVEITNSRDINWSFAQVQ